MKERMKFVVDAERGEVAFAELCRRYGISRKTGYKWRTRYRVDGVEGLKDRSRAPRHHPNETLEDVVEAVLEARREHPTWGPRKLVAWLHREDPELEVPAPSTVGAILKRHGLVARRRRRKVRVARTPWPLTDGAAPNEVWCADFKGQFKVGNGHTCWPLTVSDHCTRYLLGCQSLSNSRHKSAYPVFLALFREFGVPRVMRTDNGAPFASRAPGGLSRLSVWWIRLGIRPERIEAGHPEQNARHERMHRTLKAEATEPPEATLTAQQRQFNRFRREYNEHRPHEALGQEPPADHYDSSPKPYPSRLPKPEYDEDAKVVRVRHQGLASLFGRSVYCGPSLAHEQVAFTQVGDGVWQGTFFDYVVGRIDLREKGRLRLS